MPAGRVAGIRPDAGGRAPRNLRAPARVRGTTPPPSGCGRCCRCRQRGLVSKRADVWFLRGVQHAARRGNVKAAWFKLRLRIAPVAAGCAAHDDPRQHELRCHADAAPDARDSGRDGAAGRLAGLRGRLAPGGRPIGNHRRQRLSRRRADSGVDLRSMPRRMRTGDCWAGSGLVGISGLVFSCIPCGSRAARFRAPATRKPPRKSSSNRRCRGRTTSALCGRAQEYIAAGDIYQANLSYPWLAPWPQGLEPLAFYERLRAASPAPHSAYLDLGGTQVFSASPECFLTMSGQAHRHATGQGHAAARLRCTGRQGYGCRTATILRRSVRNW